MIKLLLVVLLCCLIYHFVKGTDIQSKVVDGCLLFAKMLSVALKAILALVQGLINFLA